MTGSSAGPAGRADPDEPASPAGSGLARERTVLSWNRSGLALVVCVAVLVRHLWPFETPGEYVALAAIAAGRHRLGCRDARPHFVGGQPGRRRRIEREGLPFG